MHITKDEMREIAIDMIAYEKSREAIFDIDDESLTAQVLSQSEQLGKQWRDLVDSALHDESVVDVGRVARTFVGDIIRVMCDEDDIKVEAEADYEREIYEDEGCN